MLKHVVLALLAGSLAWGSAASAQEKPPGAAALPAVTVRKGPDGRLEVLAAATRAPVRVDGLLNEEVWQRAEVFGGFTQSEPLEGQPASYATEVRLAYDADNLYVAAYCRDGGPGQRVVNDIRKDFRPDDQDTFELIIDTFLDRRNGYVFITNPEGAKTDQQIANEGREVNASWDAIWSVKTQRVEGGWTVEMAIPFRSLRFAPGSTTWGINFSRRIRRKNEIDFWSPVPRAYNLTRLSLAGNIAGLPPDVRSHDLRLKPYLAARTLREFGAQDFNQTALLGADLKYGITGGLTLDVTAHPDFAQAEADEQQVNLTQFSQLFPEKRDFFLENSGLFYLGDAARNNRVNPTPTPDEDLLLFFSRRIGLSSTGRPIPILGGIRLSGRAGNTSIGALTLQTREGATEPANNFAVLRLRRNVLAGSDVGVIAMSRQSANQRADYNRVLGADANVRFFGSLDWNSYLIRTFTPGITDDQYAWRTTINREGNFLHLKTGVMSIGEGFNDDMGYYRRVGSRKWLLDAGIRPRPAALRPFGVREMHPHITWNYFTDQQGMQISKKLHSGYSFFLNSGAYFEFSANPNFERIERPFAIDPTATLPAGGYGWNEWTLRGATDLSRPISLSYSATTGGFWSGSQKTVSGTLTVKPNYHFRAAFGLQRTQASLDLPDVDFTRTLLTARTNYSFTTGMFLDALLQFDPRQKQLNANVRFNLIHHPLSDLYIVYNEQRVTDPTDPRPAGRSVIVKVTQTLAF